MRHLLTVAALAVMLALPVAAQDFEKGVEAVQRGDYATALREWRPLAEQGDVKAQHNLGHMYYLGVGVPQDFAEAMKLFRKAADQGNADVTFFLGVMYHNGQGVPQDYAEAAMWLDLAARQGIQMAVRLRNHALSEMTSDQIAEAERLAREWLEKHQK